MNCRDCKFWNAPWASSRKLDYGNTECRRHAPVMAPQRFGFPNQPAWPETSAMAWCGDFEQWVEV